MDWNELALFDSVQTCMQNMHAFRVYVTDENTGEVTYPTVHSDFRDLNYEGKFTAYKEDGTRIVLVFVSQSTWSPPNADEYTLWASVEEYIRDCFLENEDCPVMVREYSHVMRLGSTYTQCDLCHLWYYDDNVALLDDGDFEDDHKMVCDYCCEKHDIITCDDCEEHFYERNMSYYSSIDRQLCCYCKDSDRYFWCNDCDELRFCEDSYHIADEDCDVCRYCFEDSDVYFHCEHCGEDYSNRLTNFFNVTTTASGYTEVWCERCCDGNTVLEYPDSSYDADDNPYISVHIPEGAILAPDERGRDHWVYDRVVLARDYVLTLPGLMVHKKYAIYIPDLDAFDNGRNASNYNPDEVYELDESRLVPYTEAEMEHIFSWTKTALSRSRFIGGSEVPLGANRPTHLMRYERTGIAGPAHERPPVIHRYHGYEKHWVKHCTPADMFRYREQIAQGLMNEDEVADRLLYIGWELEIDRAGEDPQKALQITTALGYPHNKSDEFKCSHDGSLDNGFEIISMPCTLSHHTQVYRLKEGLKKARELGYVSHDAPPNRVHGTCGLHFHVNKNFFNNLQQDCSHLTEGNSLALESALKLILVVNNNKEWLLPFSRRGAFRYCGFATPSNGDCKLNANDFVADDDVADGEILESSRGIRMLCEMYQQCGSHGSALNFANANTYEFRFCRGTLNYTTFVASLQYVQMTCEIVKAFNFKQLCSVDLDFYKKLAEKRGYNEFIKYINKRLARVEVNVDGVTAA